MAFLFSVTIIKKERVPDYVRSPPGTHSVTAYCTDTPSDGWLYIDQHVTAAVAAAESLYKLHCGRAGSRDRSPMLLLLLLPRARARGRHEFKCHQL